MCRGEFFSCVIQYYANMLFRKNTIFVFFAMCLKSSDKNKFEFFFLLLLFLTNFAFPSVALPICVVAEKCTFSSNSTSPDQQRIFTRSFTLQHTPTNTRPR